MSLTEGEEYHNENGLWLKRDGGKSSVFNGRDYMGGVSEPFTERKPHCSSRKREESWDQDQISSSEKTRRAERPWGVRKGGGQM